MNTNKKIAGMIDRNVLLSTLWIFVLFNYLYCDVLSNMEAEVLKGLMTGQIESLHSGIFAVSRNINGNSNCYGSLVPGIEV